jgi:hypothetical protein
VDGHGDIVADRRIRQDVGKYQTWSCEYVGEYLHLQQVYPYIGEPRRLAIAAAYAQYINIRRAAYSAGITRWSRHEAGHATICYAIRLTHVDAVSVEFTVIPGGNLRTQLRTRSVPAPRIIKGSISAGDLSEVNVDAKRMFAWAFQALGGIAGRDGDTEDAEDDLERYRAMIAGISSLDHAAIDRLQSELQALALQIIRDPIVSPRFEELARTLSQRLFLGRDEIENILLPSSLPDYSGAIVEIAKRFAIVSS